MLEEEADIEPPSRSSAVQQSSSFQSTSKVTKVSQQGTVSSIDVEEAMELPGMALKLQKSAASGTVPPPVQQPPIHAFTIPNITSISVHSSSLESASKMPGVHVESVQTVVHAKTESEVAKGQVIHVSAILNPSTGKQLTLALAISTGLLDVKSGTFVDPRNQKRISLTEAARVGFIDKDLVKELQQKCGLHDPFTQREMTLLEAIQKGIFDPVTEQVKDSRTGERISVDEAQKHGLLSADAAAKLSYIAISTTSTSQSRAIYGADSTERLHVNLSLAEAVEKGLYNPQTGKFRDPISNEELTLSEAIDKTLIRSDVSEVIHPVTGERLTLKEAIAARIIDPKSGQFKNPRTGHKMSLDNALHKELLQKPLSLPTVIQQGAIDTQGQVTHSGKKLKLFEAIEKGILDTDFKCILDPRTNEVLSLSEAIERGLINSEGQFVHPTTGEEVSLQDAVNKGLAQLVVEETHFAEKGVTDTQTGETLTLAESLERGFIEPKSGMYVDKRTGRKISVDQAVQIGCMKATLATELDAPSGLHDIVGQSLSVLEVLNRGLLDPKAGTVTDPTSGDTMSIQQAAAAGVLKPETAQKLLKLTSPMVTTTTVTTSVKPTGPGAITVAEAVKRGLINEEQGTFVDPTSGKTISLQQALQEGLLVYQDRDDDEEDEVDMEQDDEFIESERMDDQPPREISPSRRVDVSSTQHIATTTDTTSTVVIPKKDQQHIHKEESDEFSRDIEGGREDVKRWQKQDVVTKKTERGFETIATHEAQVLSVSSTSASVISGELPLPLSLPDSIKHGLLNAQTGIFNDPRTGQRVTFQDAVESGVLDPNSAVFHKGSKMYNLKEAIDLREMEPTGHHTRDGKRLSLEELMKLGIVVTKSVTVLPGSGKAPVISETRRTVIKSAIDTRNRQEVDVEEAVRRGILDLDAGIYTDLKTGQTLSIQDAIDRGLLKQEVSLKQSSDYVTTKAIRETRSFTITGAIDPSTGQEVGVSYAVDAGIIDQANGPVCWKRQLRKRKPAFQSVKLSREA